MQLNNIQQNEIQQSTIHHNDNQHNCTCKWLHSDELLPGKSHRRERLSTVDLLVLTTLHRLLFIVKILFALFKKTSYLNKEANGTKPTAIDIFPALTLLTNIKLARN